MANFGFSLCPVASFVSLLRFLLFFFLNWIFFFWKKEISNKVHYSVELFLEGNFHGKGHKASYEWTKVGHRRSHSFTSLRLRLWIWNDLPSFSFIHIFFSSFIYLFVIWRRWSLAVAAVGRTFNGVWLTHRFVGWLRRVPSTVSIIGVCDWFNSSLDGRVSH